MLSFLCILTWTSVANTYLIILLVRVREFSLIFLPLIQRFEATRLKSLNFASFPQF